MSERQIFVPVLSSATRAALLDYAIRSGQSIDDFEEVAREESKRALERIRAKWPVDTGFSKSMFQVSRTGSLGYQIINRAIYSGWVHRKGDRSPLSETLIPREVAAARLRILERLQPTKATLTGMGLGAFAARVAFRSAVQASRGMGPNGRPQYSTVASAIISGAKSLLTSSVIKAIKGR